MITAFLISTNNVVSQSIYTQKPLEPYYILQLEDVGTYLFSFSIEYGNNGLSGIMLAKFDGNTIRASIVNEFGIKIIDFSVSDGNVEINYAADKLNNRFVKKIIESDLGFLFSKFPPNTNNKYNYELQFNPNGSYKISKLLKHKTVQCFECNKDRNYTVTNLRNNISYKLTFLQFDE